MSGELRDLPEIVLSNPEVFADMSVKFSNSKVGWGMADRSESRREFVSPPHPRAFARAENLASTYRPKLTLARHGAAVRESPWNIPAKRDPTSQHSRPPHR